MFVRINQVRIIGFYATSEAKWCLEYFIGPRCWEGCYYVYEVSVYHPCTSQTETCKVSDPYARGYADFHISILTLTYMLQ